VSRLATIVAPGGVVTPSKITGRKAKPPPPGQGDLF
jgi:hypothetical protein